MISWLFLAVWVSMQSISTFIIVQNLKKLAVIPAETDKKTTPFITSTNPAFTREEVVGQGDSVIVTPKSPQLIEWEEAEQLRKINIRPL